MAAKRQAGYRALGYRFRAAPAPRLDALAVTRVAGDDERPSEVSDRYWIYAERSEASTYPHHGPRGGKWMLFVKNAEVDAWWSKVKAATESGLLGSSSKVATMKQNPNAASPDTRVICVYTYDVGDETDCSRVRDVLRQLGVTWKIPYKTDEDTVAGKYSKSGVRVSKRYE
jgi:hypothetical protein